MTDTPTTGETMQTTRTETDDLRDKLTRAEPMADFYRRLRVARDKRAA